MYSAETEFQGLLVTEEMLHFPKWRILNKDVSCSGKATNLTIFAWSGTNWHTNRKADTRQTNYRVGTRTRGHIPWTLHPKRRTIQPHLDSASQTHSYAQKNIKKTFFPFFFHDWRIDILNCHKRHSTIQDTGDLVTLITLPHQQEGTLSCRRRTAKHYQHQYESSRRTETNASRD